jgi:glycosyltransferase involved in cell wall biosynthesis
MPLAFSRLVKTPVVTTIHGFSSQRILPVYQAYDNDVAYVSISESDRHPDLHYAATIHHGIRLQDFPFDPAGGDHLLFYGRIHPDKGAVEAIEAAKGAARRLVMAGIIQDETYFRELVAPTLNGEQIQHIGVVGGAARGQLLGAARALLHLINFDEPFGLSVVEALACGTPVIAFNRGSMPELIEHGVTGFLVNTVDEAIDAIAAVGEIDRAACRASVESRFTVDRMTERYLALYHQLLA